MMIDFTNMLNRPLDRVELYHDRTAITFYFADDREPKERAFAVDGDCCSYSWIEHLEIPSDIRGAILMSVNDSAPITQDHPEHDDGGEISVYNTVFATDRGEIVLEYRNSSNGYYGGYLVDVVIPEVQ